MDKNKIARELVRLAKSLTAKGPSEEEIVAFLTKNPNPPDSMVHKWAEDNSWETDDVESSVYRLATKYAQGKQKKAMDRRAADEVVLDVPLLIRVMEYSKEDAETDMDLHVATENMIRLSEGGKVLTMENYDEIVGGSKGD